MINRGSEWHKWDLHIHTKGTNKNDQYSCSCFEDFCKEMFSKAIENNISAIGITDYYSIDNYKKVIEYQEAIDDNSEFSNEEKEIIKAIFIIPNVELRLLPVTDRGRLVNIHMLFNPDYVEELDNDFFNDLKHSSHSREFPMNRAGLISLGRQVDRTVETDEQAYKIGVNNFVVTHASLKALLQREIFRNNTIVVVSNSSQDGNSAYQHHYDLFENDADSSLDDIRSSIYHLSDCIFSGNQKDQIYFLGKGSDGVENIKRKCGSLKACIHGSDAHTEAKLFHPDNNRFCWIKADLTFEGLRQIIYEPERVKIQENNPYYDREKSPFTEILINEETPVFSDGDIKFAKQTINLNSGLVSIIGGRGTGKSRLIDYIASGLGKKTTKEYALSSNVIVKRKTSLRDEESSFVLTDDNHIDFMYIRQSEVKDIVENRDEFSRKIRETIGVYESYCENHEFQERISSLLTEYSGISAILNADYTTSSQKKEAIESEIKKYNDYIANITSSENKARLEQYKKYVEEDQSYSKLLEQIKNIVDNILRYQKEQNVAIDEIETILKERVDNNIIIPRLDYSPTVSALQNTIDNSIKEKLANIQKAINQTKETFKDYNGDLTSLLDNVKTYQEHVVAKTKEKENIEKSEDRLQIIRNEELRTIGIQIKDGINNYKNQIEQKWQEFKNGKEGYSEELCSLLNEILSEDELDVHVEVKLDIDKMYELLHAPLDKRSWKLDSLKRFININNIDDYYNFIIQCTNPEEKSGVQKLVDEQLDNILLPILLRDYTQFISHDVIVTSHGKPITKLSHGQQGTIYLRLQLAANLFYNTIIYDQPEDDLDNDFITNRLVDLFRKIKQYRQVIIVSHNANLVVNGDSEQVIVADNKDGVLSYTSGSLETPQINDAVCRILEGGQTAFEKREQRYGLR